MPQDDIQAINNEENESPDRHPQMSRLVIDRTAKKKTSRTKPRRLSNHVTNRIAKAVHRDVVGSATLNIDAMTQDDKKMLTNYVKQLVEALGECTEFEQIAEPNRARRCVLHRVVSKLFKVSTMSELPPEVHAIARGCYPSKEHTGLRAGAVPHKK